MSGPSVWKFGGTSLRDAARVRAVAALVAEAPEPVVVVASAPAGVTEALLALTCPGAGAIAALDLADLRSRMKTIADDLGGSALVDEIDEVIDRRIAQLGAEEATDPAARDALLALGEDVSVRLLEAALDDAGVRAERVDARGVIRTDDHFGAAAPILDAIAAGAEVLAGVRAGTVAVVQGFIGADAEGRTTTLGRGGSDLTATLLGAALDSSAVHIWTDVDGILSGDPRWVERPRSLEVVGFEEAVELAWFGAQVIHAGAAKHAVAHRVPVRIRSTFAPERPGTLILPERWGGPDIASVACKRAVALIQVRSRPSAIEYGFLARVFGILTRHRTPVDLVATSHTSTAFTLDEDADLDPLAAELDEVAEVEVRRGLATITVVGRGLLREPGFAARVFQTVAFTSVHLISQATDSSLSFLVDDIEAEALVRRLHLVLIEGRMGHTEISRSTG
ncbi:MAG: aspartate kinase [Longimicrobiales bacterium]|nr:aspartate kinase [Longimicrobiales bacterium]